MTSHEYCGVSNHWHIDCLFNGLFKTTTKRNISYFWPKRFHVMTSFCSMCHYSDVIMGTVASQITSLIIVYSTVYSGTDQRKHRSAQRASNADNVSIWWRHHVLKRLVYHDVAQDVSYTWILIIYDIPCFYDEDLQHTAFETFYLFWWWSEVGYFEYNGF